MAYTQQAHFSFTVQDGLGTKASMIIYALLDPTKTVANLVTDIQAWATLIEPIIDSKILLADAVVSVTPTVDQTGKPADASRVEQTGVFNFANGSTTRRFGEAVPALADAVITGGTIDLADTDVAAFVTAMGAASGTATSQATNNSFQDLTSLVDAFLSFRKRRKQLLRSSFEV